MIGTLLVTLFIILIVTVIVQAVGHPDASPADRQSTRRIFQYVLLFGLTMVTAVGISGLLARIMQPHALDVAGDAFLARSIAFTVVGIPLLSLVAAWIRHQLKNHPREQGSTSWVLYVIAVSLVSLIMLTSSASELLQWAFGLTSFKGYFVADTLVWGAVWGIHWRLSHRLVNVDRLGGYFMLGAFIGLVVSVVGLSEMLSGSARFFFHLDQPTLIGKTSNTALHGLTLFLVGAAIWLWYWLRHGIRTKRDPAWLTYVLLIGVGGGLAAALTATSFVFYQVLVWLIGHPGSANAKEFFDSLPTALSIALVAGLVWWYHDALMRVGPVTARGEVERIRDYLLAMIALFSASGGLVLLVVAGIQTMATGTIVTGGRELNTLIAALTLLVVGGPTWGWFWSRGQRAARQEPAAEYASPTRRIYLYSLLGVASIVALAALLAGTYFLIDDILGAQLGLSTLDRMRFPIAFLVTAGAIASYHWAVWAVQRKQFVNEMHGPKSVLLIGPDQPAVAADIAKATKSRVRVWVRTDGVGEWNSTDIISALADCETHESVVVIADPSGPRVIPVRR